MFFHQPSLDDDLEPVEALIAFFFDYLPDFAMALWIDR